MTVPLRVTSQCPGHPPIIPVLRKWRQQDQKFKAILDYIAAYVELEANLGYMKPSLSKTKGKPLCFDHFPTSIPGSP